jgi:hypothetical protein
MVDGQKVKKLFKGKPGGRRRQGRARLRRTDDVGADYELWA